MVSPLKLLQRWLIDVALPQVFRVLRRFRPRLRLGKYVLISTFDDVQEVLARPDHFVAPYGSKAGSLGWDPQFLLGIENVRGGEYKELHDIVRGLWREGDVGRIARITRRTTVSAIRSPDRSIDAMQQIIVASAVAVVDEYFGITVQDADRLAFLDSTGALLAHLFGLPNPSWRAAQKARRHANVIFHAIDRALDAKRQPGDDSIVARTASRPDLRAVHRSCLMGLISGFVPAFTNGAGRALHVLLDQPVASQAMRRAIATGDADGIKRLCYEALRFRYVLPFLWRRVLRTTDIAANSDAPFRLHEGDYAVLSPLSAMQDGNRILAPREFQVDRSPHVYLTYGYAYHDCIGRIIADTMFTEIFSALYEAEVERVKQTRWRAMVPRNIYVKVDAAKPQDRLMSRCT